MTIFGFHFHNWEYFKRYSGQYVTKQYRICHECKSAESKTSFITFSTDTWWDETYQYDKLKELQHDKQENYITD